jgi:hypothetical protein
MEIFNLKQLNKIEGKEQYRVEVSNRFTALENLVTEVANNRAWRRQQIVPEHQYFYSFKSVMSLKPHNKQYVTMVSHISNKCAFILFISYTVYDYVAYFNVM